MKLKLFSVFIAATALMSVNSHAVSLALTGIANTTGTIGLITVDPDNKTPFPPGGLENNAGRVAVTGRAIFVSVTTALTSGTGAGSVFATMNSLLASTTSTPAQFDAALTSLITANNTIAALTNPGIVRTTAFTTGALTSTGAAQLGVVANKTYMFLVAESGGFITGIGAYTGANVAAAAITFNSAFADTLGVGTSTVAAATTAGVGVPFTQVVSGFQLAAAGVPVPEPSAALLGAFGALALLRRRRN